ncbi:hypothetical protein AURDEDRAFT_116935 [Auricularia subglabra TFB-10046 SS5]|uniref:Uncharacterized protein n=1 Tax=Auricularia subglabra (strain TFB-10046 / SS5) TaxID=717982 RepID=J0WU09_AURST|nr:hypothetical protein AURDEDRAFT_116935 [Auricularia subglabra TFB-10046 SS5]
MLDVEGARITYVGTQVAILLFGISLVQSWVFFQECSRDPVHLRLTALIILYDWVISHIVDLDRVLRLSVLHD